MQGLTAGRCEKALASGRTRPLLRACEEADEDCLSPMGFDCRR